VRFPEDHHTSTVEGAAAWERARGEADDDVADDRRLDARDEIERDAVLYCETCDQTVTGPCTQPVDMGGGMVDTPCAIEEG
jgi:hypothetical protein